VQEVYGFVSKMFYSPNQIWLPIYICHLEIMMLYGSLKEQQCLGRLNVVMFKIFSWAERKHTL